MKISSSEVAFSSQHQKQSVHEYREARQEQSQQWSLGAGERLAAQGSQVDISYNARMRSEQSSSSRSSSIVSGGDQVQVLQQSHNVREIVSSAIGRNITVTDIQAEEPRPVQVQLQAVQQVRPVQLQAYESIQSLDALIISTLTGEEPVGAPLREFDSQQLDIQIGATMPALFRAQDSRISIQQSHRFEEQERLQVASQGVITTADGREISFMLELDMERSFELEESLEEERMSRALIDPLVINLSGGTAALTSSSFSFDLDADGSKEDISFVAGGSGFLALDINEDGKINDGSELFGTQGVEGFAHLARYDDDGNRWIDESDEIFSKLKVWTRDEQGVDQLVGLKEAGVGAIHLGSTSSTFDLTDSENNLLGQVKRSGIFLMENGTAASIQELDLAVHGNQPAAGFELQAQFDRSQFYSQRNGDNPQLSLTSDDAPSFIELMLPPVDQEDRRPRTLAEIEQEQIRLARQSEEDSSEVTEAAAEEPGLRVVELDQSRLELMARLREKTLDQQERESDQFSQMKLIIEDLNQKREQQQDGVKPEGDPDLSSFS